MKRTPYTRIKRTRLNEAQSKRLESMHRAFLSAGYQFETFMIEVGELQPTQRRILTREMIQGGNSTT